MTQVDKTTPIDHSASIASVVAVGKVWNECKRIQSEAGASAVGAFQYYVAMFILQVLVMNKATTKDWLDAMQALANGDGGWSEGKRFAYGAFLNKFRKHLRNGQSGELIKLVKAWLDNYSDDDAKLEAIKAELVEMKITSYSKMYNYDTPEVVYTNAEKAFAKTIVANAVANHMIANDETVIENAIAKFLPMVRVWTNTLDDGSETTTVTDKSGDDTLADALANAGAQQVA